MNELIAPIEIYPHEFEPNFHELEYSLPAASAHDAFESQREFMRHNLPDSIFPMEFRFVAADQAWLSPNYMRDSEVSSTSLRPTKYCTPRKNNSLGRSRSASVSRTPSSPS